MTPDENERHAEHRADEERATEEELMGAGHGSNLVDERRRGAIGAAIQGR